MNVNILGGSHEGGVRTPAIIKGGLVENILQKNKNLTNNTCEYDGLVHISDWYHILMDITKITVGYEPDSDHGSLSIWNNIKCNCLKRKQYADSKCDRKYPPRDEVITMRLCGDPEGSYRDGNKFFYSAFIRKGDYKLVVKFDKKCMLLLFF